MARVLGIDVGLKRIGLAVGDTEVSQAFARPALLVSDWKQAWDPLVRLIGTENISTVIVGWPLHSSGQASEQSQIVQQFIDQLRQKITVPILTRDERGSSQAVQREQQAAGQHLTRGQEDSLAAQLLVEAWLQEPAT